MLNPPKDRPQPDKLQSYFTYMDMTYNYELYCFPKHIVRKNSGVDSKSSFKTQHKTTKLTTVNIDKQMSNMAHYLEDNLQYVWFYIELQGDNGVVIQKVISQKGLINILVANPARQEWKQIAQGYMQCLLNFLMSCSKIVNGTELELMNEMELHLCGVHAMQTQGGLLMNRDKPGHRHLLDQLSKCKQELLMNEEFEFTEYSYDIKIFKVLHPLEMNIKQELHIYIYSLNDPDT